jgi:hypothetical protein
MGERVPEGGRGESHGIQVVTVVEQEVEKGYVPHHGGGAGQPSDSLGNCCDALFNPYGLKSSRRGIVIPIPVASGGAGSLPEPGWRYRHPAP